MVSTLRNIRNNSAPMPDLPKNAPPMPTAASLRILRRPSPATSASSSSHQNFQGGDGSGNNGSNEALNEQRDGGVMFRGSPGGGGGNGSRSGSRRNKTLIEREEEYKRARERIFGTTEGSVSGGAVGEAAVPDNRSEVSGGESGAVTPARSGSSSTGSVSASTASGVVGGGSNQAGPAQGQPQAQTPTSSQSQSQSRSGSVGPGSSTSSSSRARTGPTQSSKRRGESHFEPLRPPGSGGSPAGPAYQSMQVGGNLGPMLPSMNTTGGMGYPRGATRDRFNASGYGPMGMYQAYEPAPYGMGLSGGMPYQGTAQQQQQQQPGGFSMYPQLAGGYQPGQGQTQPQLGMAPGGYGRMGGAGNMGGFGAGPMRQPIGPGDADGMGFGQLRLNDAMPYGGGTGGSGGNVGYSDGWHGPPRPAYSSSSSSASSDVGSTGGYGHDSMYRGGGPMPPPQQQQQQHHHHQQHPYAAQPQPQMMYNTNNNSNNSNINNSGGKSNNMSHLHGMEQPQPGYMGGRAGPGAYGQAWPALRKGSGPENGSGDSGYTR